MIRLKNVSKYYPTKQGRKYALKNVTFTIPTHVNIGILGPNGAGKSTLLRLLGGIDFPNQGKIEFDENISWPVGLGSAYQGSMTGRQNTRFVGRIYGVDDLDRFEEEVAEFLEFGSYFDMPVKTYSSGMKSRFTFALSMAFDFDIYLLDEVGAAGDKRFKERSILALESKRKRARFIMVSHSMSELKRVCQTGILLKEGVVTYYPDIDEAIEVYLSLAN